MMNKTICIGALALAMSANAETIKEVRLMTLDPGHFHAALVQKLMYDQVSPVVNVYAPDGPEVQAHLKRIDGFNSRADNPTRWQEKVHLSPDFFERLIKEKPGNVVVLSGNNAKKTEYIMGCVDAGLNVLADKPMAINPVDFKLLRQALDRAAEKGVLLYDIMTERSEITTILQKELSLVPEVFGKLERGTERRPAVTKESVHHFFKEVSGKPLVRPPWAYDVTQQGEGVVDVTTHLVDLIQWECFPEQTLNWRKDIQMLSARRWATKVTPEQFKRSTQLDEFPDYLKQDVGGDGALNVYCNGEINYRLKGIYAKVSVIWNYEAPPGAKDTHYSMMRGSKANLVIKQGKEQNYKPVLYVENKARVSAAAFEKTLKAAVAKLNAKYPGVEVARAGEDWAVVVPAKYDIGHEAHFAQVTERYLKYLAAGKLPDWEVPNMIAKYYITTAGYELSR